jgi:hypothetical protein
MKNEKLTLWANQTVAIDLGRGAAFFIFHFSFFAFVVVAWT